MYLGVAVAVLSAAADLILTIVFRDKLLAAERIVAEDMPPLPDEPSGVGFSVSTDTFAFARGPAIAVLVVTVVCGLIAVVLARAVARGSDNARIGLAVLAGVYGAMSMCPCVLPISSLFEDPAVGTFLNVWSAVGTALGFLGAGFGFAVLILLLQTRAGRLTPNP